MKRGGVQRHVPRFLTSQLAHRLNDDLYNFVLCSGLLTDLVRPGMCGDGSAFGQCCGEVFGELARDIFSCPWNGGWVVRHNLITDWLLRSIEVLPSMRPVCGAPVGLPRRKYCDEHPSDQRRTRAQRHNGLPWRSGAARLDGVTAARGEGKQTA